MNEFDYDFFSLAECIALGGIVFGILLLLVNNVAAGFVIVPCVIIWAIIRLGLHCGDLTEY